MKKINLNQLSMSWNERKRQQRFGRYAAMLITLLTLGVGQMWGANSTEENRTVYYAVPASVVGSYEVRINSNIGDEGTWRQNTMSCVGTYNNGAYVVYQGNAVEKYGGVDGIQFQLYDDKGTWKDQEVAIDTWKTYDKIEGKMFIYGTTKNADWSTYSTDGSITYKIYFVNKDNWANPYAYAYNTNCSNNGTWPGVAMSSASKTHDSSGKAIYSITLSSRLYKVIFSNNGSSQLSAEDCYDDNVSKMYYNGSWYTLQYRVTLDDEGGNGDGTASVNAVCGSAMTTITPPTKDDYTFAGYYTATSGSGTKYYNANGTSANTWPNDGTGPTTLHAHWTQEPGVTGLSVSAGDVYSGENTITLTATRNSAASSSNIQYQVKVPGGSWTNIGDAVNSLTMTYSPTSGHGTYEFRAYPSGYSVNNREASKTVYEHWTIYVRDHVDNWGSMYLYLYDNSASTEESSWPGTACSKYNSTDKWYAVTLDSKWPNFILNNNSTKQLLGGGNIETDKSTYPNGSYWYTQWHSDGTGGDSGKKFYTLTSASVDVPEVEITSCNVYSTYALLEGHVTDNGGDGNSLSDLKEYGFYLGATKYSGGTYVKSTSGTYFRVKISGLTPGTEYAIKAFATNVLYTGYSSTQNKTTSDASRTIGIRYPNTTSQTLKIYAYRDISSDYGTETKKNEDWSGVTLTRRTGTTRWWETTIENAADYQYFIVSNNGSNQAAAQTMPATDKCYWYDPSGDPNKIGEMDCPYSKPQLYINATAGGTDYAYNEMSTSPSISKTKNLTAGTYTFKIMYTAEWYGKGSDQDYSISRTGATSSNDISSMAIDEGYITLNADFDGDYTFTFDPSSNTVSVTYPEAYTVTYSAIRIGNGTAWDTDPSATYTTGGASITSTHYVPVETDVTFTADDANEGYTWKGWYDGPTLSDNKLSTDDDLTYALEDIGANTTVYAIYQEDMHTVTVTAGAHGSITTPTGSGSTVQAGIATTADIVTTNADYGYYFSGWTVVSGSATFGSASAKSTTVNATSDATIQANYVSHWTIAGGDGTSADGDNDEMGDWNVYKNGIEDFAQDASEDWIGHVDIDLPANTTFYFKVRDLNNTKWYSANSEMTYSNHTDWKMYDNVSENCRITTAGKGKYRFTWNETKEKLTVTYPTSYTVTYNVSTFYNEDASHDYDNTTGGSITYKKDNDSIELTSGKYVVAGGTMTFKATPASGYRFAGWYQNQACSTEYTNGSDGAVIDDGVLTLTILDDENNKTVYAKFMENMTTVNFASTHGHVEIGGETVTSTKVGVHTKYDVTADPDDGYYFAGWTIPDGADCSVEDDTEAGNNDPKETELSGLGAGTDGTITAKFVELERVYFRNWNADSSEPLWTNVYVYFTTGESEGCPVANVSGSYKAQMTQEGTSNNYWAYVPRGVTKNTEGNIAFSNTNFDTGETFGSGEGVMRADYRAGLSMFVPRHSSIETKCSMTFYKGYWKHHNLEPGTISGYSIERYTGGSSYEPAADNGGDNVNFIVLNEDKIQYSLRVDNTGDGHNNYRINSKGGIHYITYNTSPAETGYTITTSNYQDIHMSEYLSGSPRFYITPTTQNLYTLTIDQSGDEMKLTVDYPVALGDYRIVHTYSSGTKKAYSDIIKSSEAASGVTASMYINTSGSPTLTLEKCTAITPSVTWTAQSQGSVWSSYRSSFTENGVYKFDVTITKDDVNDYGSRISDITNIGIYDGEFYIKTDCGKGGWTAWKANVMEKNTITFNKADATTFDHSYCHWVGNVRGDAKPTNVKCVIANDYNIAVSDTLVGDEILGTYKDKDENDVPYENLPSAAHVRFSYNSTSNELKRTYLAVEGVDHLVLEGNKSAGGDYMILNSSGADFDDENKAVLGNQSNFTFMLDITAREKARVRLSAKYNGKIQDLVGHITSNGYGEDLTAANTVEIIGGSIEKDRYDNLLRITYDFKTNQLLSAWLAPTSSNSPNKAINADVMIIREGQDDARQITFANSSDKLSAVDTVYGVMKFEKSTLNNSSLSPYERDLYWISFPFAVKLSDAFGMGTYGTHWIIERYDGKGRAKNGFWADSESNWKFVTPYERDNGFIMNANEGYILALDLDELGEGSLVWDNDMTDAYLYFPSKDKVGNIKTKDVTVEIDTVGYTCTIGPRFENGDDRRIKDSHWHCIGAPSFANINHAATTGWVDENSDGINDYPNAGTIESWKSSSVLYVYDWNSTYNTLTPVSAASHNFKAMHSYMVQYSQPSISWSSVTTPSASIAARMTETPDREYKLALLREDDEQDHTFVRLTDDENVSTGFEFNYDLSKEMNRNRGNIWTVTADTVQVAGNSQPHPLTTTVVPVGVKIAANGEYTFSMPEGTNGGDVWLIDNANSSRTNLGLMDYTVNLTTGTYEGRFSLEFPVQNVVTDIENAANANANANADAVRKVFVGGQLYIIRDGVIYNASGARVQ